MKIGAIKTCFLLCFKCAFKEIEPKTMIDFFEKRKKNLFCTSLYISQLCILSVYLFILKSWILLFSKIHPNLFSFIFEVKYFQLIFFFFSFSTSTTYSIDFCNIYLLCKLEVSSLKTNLQYIGS